MNIGKKKIPLEISIQSRRDDDIYLNKNINIYLNIKYLINNIFDKIMIKNFNICKIVQMISNHIQNLYYKNILLIFVFYIKSKIE